MKDVPFLRLFLICLVSFAIGVFISWVIEPTPTPNPMMEYQDSLEDMDDLEIFLDGMLRQRDDGATLIWDGDSQSWINVNPDDPHNIKGEE